MPLYRLLYDPDILADCGQDIDIVPNRDFAFTTTVAGVRYFKETAVDSDGIGYDLEGREGFLFESCEGQPGCTPPPGTVRVYRMAGTDPLDLDTDCDGESDGDEVLKYNLLLGDYGDPLAGPCLVDGFIFFDGFESGTVSQWSSAIP